MSSRSPREEDGTLTNGQALLGGTLDPRINVEIYLYSMPLNAFPVTESQPALIEWLIKIRPIPLPYTINSFSILIKNVHGLIKKQCESSQLCKVMKLIIGFFFLLCMYICNITLVILTSLFVHFLFQVESCHVAQAGLKLGLLMPHDLKHQGRVCAESCLVSISRLSKKALCLQKVWAEHFKSL